MKIRFNYTIMRDREKTKTYLEGLENRGRWVMRGGIPTSPREVFNTYAPFKNVVAMPVISVSDVIECALREVDAAHHKVKLIASRAIINITD